MKRNLYRLLGLLLVAVAAITMFLIYRMPTQGSATPKKTATEVDHSKNKPVTNNYPVTLFFHGYGGTSFSMGGMIQRLSNHYQAIHTLDLMVQSDGQIQEKGHFQTSNKPILINVLFEDNKNNEWNQAAWIEGVLSYLKTQYQISEVNVVGHSMGGVSLFRYLFTYANQSEVAHVNKFIAIAAPFNEFIDSFTQQNQAELLQNGPAIESARYQDFANSIAQFPSDIQVTLFAGKLSADELDDGTVPLSSALAVNSLLINHGNQVQTKIFTGIRAQHSALHANSKVDQAVAEILWSKRK